MKLLIAVLMMVFSSAGFAEPKHLRTETWNSIYLLCELSGGERIFNFTLKRDEEKTFKGSATVLIENRREVYDDPKENFEDRLVIIGGSGNPFFTVVVANEKIVEQTDEKEFKFSTTPFTPPGEDTLYLSINRITGTLSYRNERWDSSIIGHSKTLRTTEFFGSCEKQTKQKF